MRWVSFLRTCITFPKDPFPITLSKSNASIVKVSCRAGLYAIVRWKDPDPDVAVYHWSETCCKVTVSKRRAVANWYKDSVRGHPVRE